MVTSRNPDASSSPSSADDEDPLSSVISSIANPAFGVAAPVSTRSTVRSVAPPPSSMRSAPASTRVIGGGARGYLTGKHPLFRHGPSKDGTLCCGFIGGPKGSRMRFCIKALAPDSKHCGDSKHGGKFAVTPESYYIRMENDTALCRPFVRLADLKDKAAMNLVNRSLPSKEWVEVIVNRFWIDNDLLPLPPRAADSITLGDEGSLASVKEEVADPDVISALGNISSSGEVFTFEQDADETKPSASMKLPDSVASVTDAWLSMEPTSHFPDSTPMMPEENWFPPFEDARRSILSLQHSVSRMLKKLPKAFDAIETTIEERLVSYEELQSSAVVPVQELCDKLSALQVAIFESADSLYASPSFDWTKYGSVLGAVEVLWDKVASVESHIDSSFGEHNSKDEMKRLAAKMAEGLSVIFKKSSERTEAVEQRVAVLEAGSKPGIESLDGSVSDSVDLIQDLMGKIIRPKSLLFPKLLLVIFLAGWMVLMFLSPT